MSEGKEYKDIIRNEIARIEEKLKNITDPRMRIYYRKVINTLLLDLKEYIREKEWTKKVFTIEDIIRMIFGEDIDEEI